MLSYLIIFILNLKNLYLCNCFRLLLCLLCLFFLFWKWLILREGTVFVRGKCGEDYALSFKWWMLPGKASFFFFGTCNSEVVARFVGNILGLNSYSIECAQSSLLSPGTAKNNGPFLNTCPGTTSTLLFFCISELWLLNLNIIASFWMNHTQCIKVFF